MVGHGVPRVSAKSNVVSPRMRVDLVTRTKLGASAVTSTSPLVIPEIVYRPKLSVTADRVEVDVPFTVTVADAMPAADPASVTVPRSVNVTAAVTVNDSDPLRSPYVALISTEPALTAVTIPPFVTVATDVLDDRHAACDVTAWLVPSLRVAIAAN
jgi:hypothetical protein